MSRKIKVEDAINNIKKICNEGDLLFLGFCDKDGNKCEWYGNTTKLALQCKICGNKWYNTNYNSFTVRKTKCHFCAKKKKRTQRENFKDRVIEKCIERNYEFLGFCDKEGKIIEKPLNAVKTYLYLKCNICGNEWKSTNYNSFINSSQGCPQCKKNNIISQTRWKLEDIKFTIKEKCKEQNYDFMGFCDKNGKECDFGKIKYTYLNLKCNNCGNIWTTTNIDSFINNNCGCPKCKTSSVEQEIVDYLNNLQISYTYRDRTILNGLELDFYFSQYNAAIECQGIQHFKPIDFAGKGEEWAKEIFKGTCHRDECKRKLCKEHGIKLFYYSNLNIKYPYQVYEDKEELLREIKK